MSITPQDIVLLSWAGFFIYWTIKRKDVKPTKGKKWSNMWIKMAWIRIIMMAIVILVIFLSRKLNFYNSFVAFSQVHFPPLQYLGALLAPLGLAIAVAARRKLAGNWSSSVDLKKDHELITTGVYAYMRHPIYSGMTLLGLGTLFVFQSLIVLIVFIFLAVIFLFRIKAEEDLMTKTFPNEYPEYRKRVKSLIPFIF